MKNILFPILIISVLASCSKSEIEKSRNSLQTADSLLQSANDGFKTLDSISQIVNDSAKFRQVIVPEIDKHKKAVEEAIEGHSINVDSVKAMVQNAKEKIEQNQDLVKDIDSATKSVQESKSAMEVISTIGKTIDKISGREENAKPTPEIDKAPENNSNPTANIEADEKFDDFAAPTTNQLKTKTTTLQVDDISRAKSEFNSDVIALGGFVYAETFLNNNGEKSAQLKAQIPLKNFEKLSTELSNLGTVVSDEVMSSGNRSSANDLAEFEVNFIEQALIQNQANHDVLSANQLEKNQEDYSLMAWVKKGIIYILFPLLLLILIWMGIKSKKKEQREETTIIPAQNRQSETPASTPVSNENTEKKENKPEKSDEEDEDPYAKYRPK